MKLQIVKFIRAFLIGIALVFSFAKPIHYTPAEHFTDQQCLTANIFFEARGESSRGMQAVAAVTYNRADSKVYPKDICNVVFQKKQFSWTSQQSYATILAVLQGNLVSFNKKDIERYQQAVKIAQRNRKHFLDILPKNVLHYHSVKVKPYWSKSKSLQAQIGNHLFYR